MITGADVLSFLLPNGGWAISGNEYENIIFLEAEPITKAQFEAGFLSFDLWNAQQIEAKATDKAALLAQLGITEDQAKLLLS